jgi:transcriptional regulator with XRE-family HTH domain
MRGKIDNTEYYKNLGKNLLRIREGYGLLQREVADKMGVTFQQYQKYERGENRIPAKSLVTFCELTNTDIKEITGCTVESYEKVYKEATVNYNTSNNVTNVYHYNGFFSNLLNMDLTLMRNKVVVVSVVINLLVYFGLNLLKWFPEINAQYNATLLSVQFFALSASFAISLFSVFSYSILTYGVTFIVYMSLYAIFVRFMEAYYSIKIPVIGIDRLIMYGVCLLLTFLTFYILKKCKVNLNLSINKKEA